MTAVYSCASVSVGDWFQGPRGHQNSQMLKFLMKSGLASVGELHLHTGCAQNACASLQSRGFSRALGTCQIKVLPLWNLLEFFPLMFLILG